MSEFADLEDDVPDQQEPRQDALFGDDDDDDDGEDYNPGQDAHAGDDDDDDDGGTAGDEGKAGGEDVGLANRAAGDAGPSGQVIDVKARLAALAAKKRKEAAQEGGKKKKKDKGDKGDKDGKKRKRDKDKGTRRSSRRKGGEDGEDGDEEEAVPRKPRARGEDGPQGSVDSKELQEEDADRAFLDDEVEGGQEEEKIGSDVMDDEEEDGDAAPPPEALEAADAEDDLFGRSKKKKKRETDGQMAHDVDNKIAKMEVAAELDVELKGKGQPAVAKLKLVNEIEEFLAQRKYHEQFIHAGGLGVLKAWLEPYVDGTLPNVRVRTAVLNGLKLLPVDTTREDIKESLKKSQLGSRIMFLAKCPDETQANKRVAIELVQQWSRPIFFDADAEAEKRRIREDSLRRARVMGQEAQRAQEEAAAAKLAESKGIKYGEKGYRWHAMIPQTSKLDYVVGPRSDPTLEAAANAATGTGTGKRDEGRFSKKMREVQRKQKGSTARAAVPSVEGRSIVF